MVKHEFNLSSDNESKINFKIVPNSFHKTVRNINTLIVLHNL